MFDSPRARLAGKGSAPCLLNSPRSPRLFDALEPVLSATFEPVARDGSHILRFDDTSTSPGAAAASMRAARLPRADVHTGKCEIRDDDEAAQARRARRVHSLVALSVFHATILVDWPSSLRYPPLTLSDSTGRADGVGNICLSG